MPRTIAITGEACLRVLLLSLGVHNGDEQLGLSRNHSLNANAGART
jgi:hypothetical protein